VSFGKDKDVIYVGGSVTSNKGSSYGGGAWTNGKGNGGISGSYGKYGATVGQQNGTTTVGGSYTSVGPYGTKVVSYGNVNFSGKNSSINGGADIYDPTGMIRLGGASSTMDRTQYRQTSDLGIGGFRANNGAGVRFNGTKSDLTVNEGVNLGGMAKYNTNVSANYKVINAEGNINIFGAKANASANAKFSGMNSKISVDGKVLGNKISFDSGKFSGNLKNEASSISNSLYKSTIPILKQDKIVTPSLKIPNVKIENIKTPTMSVPKIKTPSVKAPTIRIKKIW
jgi:hypothetical protein